jgi:hypothetical protein
MRCPECGDLRRGGVTKIDYVGACGYRGSTGRSVACDGDKRASIGQSPAHRVVRHVPEHGTMATVPVIMFLVAVAILIGVVYVAIGRGGELGTDTPTWMPTSGGFMNMAGVQVQLPPTTIIGYDVHATLDELQWLAQALGDRNSQVAALRMEVARLQQERGEPVTDVAGPGMELAAAPPAEAGSDVPPAARYGGPENAE